MLESFRLLLDQTLTCFPLNENAKIRNVPRKTRQRLIKIIYNNLTISILAVHFMEFEDAIKMLKALKELGVGLSIDDFGTGYSSLAYLRQFPIDHLKIDKTFIDDVDTDNSNAAIVKAVIAMANNMKLMVTAEGVEKIEQLNFLKELHCSEVQGYYFSKPLKAEEVVEFSDKFKDNLIVSPLKVVN